jgi:hypothetical protein
MLIAITGDPTGVVPGFWGSIYRTVFFGYTQTQSVYADFRGPATPDNAERCVRGAFTINSRIPGVDLCVLPEHGMVVSYNEEGISQHMLHLYDGPMMAIDLHFENIKANAINCLSVNNVTVILDRPWCQRGVPKGRELGQCINPNAAIGWKVKDRVEMVIVCGLLTFLAATKWF